MQMLMIARAWHCLRCSCGDHRYRCVTGSAAAAAAWEAPDTNKTLWELDDKVDGW